MNLLNIHHIAIIVSDYDAAKDFYVNKLGFSVIRENYRPGEIVERSKALGDIRGVTYIYGMFYRFGLIAYCLNVTIQSHAKLRSANACI